MTKKSRGSSSRGKRGSSSRGGDKALKYAGIGALIYFIGLPLFFFMLFFIMFLIMIFVTLAITGDIFGEQEKFTVLHNTSPKLYDDPNEDETYDKYFC